MREQLADIEKSSLMLISGLLLLVVVAGMSLYLIKPAYKSWAITKNSYDVLNNAALADIDLSSNILLLEQERDEIAEKIGGDSASLPFKQVESHVIGKLQQLAWDNNLRLAGVKPSMGDKVGEFREVLFNVGLSGHFRDVYAMLGDLKQQLGFVVVQNMAIASQRSDRDAELLRIDMIIASYRVEN